MLIENSPHDKYMGVLNFGSFPRKVIDFEESQDFFQQIIFVDYQLLLLLRHEFGGKLFARASPSNCSESIFEKISQLLAYAGSVDANYASSRKSYEEVLYYTVVVAHLHHLNADFENCYTTLKSIQLAPDAVANLRVINDFVAYLTARYYALLGTTSVDSSSSWIEYLVNMRRYGIKSNVAANDWTDSIFKHVLAFLSSNGSTPLRFKDLVSQLFSDNSCSLVAVANYAMRPENEKYICEEFRTDYISFLAELLINKISQKAAFPHASDEDFSELNFVETLYETINDISAYRPVVNHILKPTLSKRFLVNIAEKSYQNQAVIANLARSLLDTKEYDEALAAFKTYINYIDKDTEQHAGAIRNLLEVIDLYATCIYDFNPIRSVIPNGTEKKFVYNTPSTVVENLKNFSARLLEYLNKFNSVAELTYDDALESFSDNDLSFLYYRYNTNFLATDKSKIVKILSRAWFALGQFHYYLAMYASADEKILEDNTTKVALFYKNSLIVNLTGNVVYLFNYAYTLAQTNSLEASIRLCKFILKRYPESFKTWNLLVLLKSASEQRASMLDLTAKTVNKTTILDNATEHESNNGEKYEATALKKFIEDALNIAGLYMIKSHQNGVPLSLQIKYQILQLKMTQLAVWEANEGVEYILESITDVFALYRELFQESGIPSQATERSVVSRAEGRWSHRPSVIDPADATIVASGGKKKDKSLAKEKIKRLSHVAHDRDRHALTKTERATALALSESNRDESRILQELWLWTASIYLKLGLLEEAEQCIVEAETAEKPNVKTFTFLGLLTSKTRKFLALQEYERSLEVFHSPEERYSCKAYGLTLLGMCKLFIIDDESENSLFISDKDRDAGLIRLKNYLEQYSLCWPHGANCSELWYYLSTIYERFDDKVLFKKALWKCVDLESERPVRSYAVCDDFR